MSMKNQLKKSLPNLPLILRGGMEGIKLLFMALVLKMSLIIPAQATTCAVPPTCKQMGYTMKKADCGGNPVLRCPFALSDDSQVFCGVAAASGEADKDTDTNTDNEMDGVVQNVTNGAIIYTDGTVTNSKVTGKTPMGVVFDAGNRLAMALVEVKDDVTGEMVMTWANKAYKIPDLQNCNTSVIPSGEVSYPASNVSCGVDGRSNTNAILACGSDCGGTPAATTANNFQPAGCIKDFCKKTKWFLPSMRDIMRIYEQKAMFNTTLRKVSTIVPGTKFTAVGNALWSSTQNGLNAWVVYMSNGIRSCNGKESNASVRPVLKF